jgi:hypothetical protein
MRTIKAGRLYSIGHDLLKENAEKLLDQILQTMEGRDFLFLGIGKDALFLEGNFHQGRDALFKGFVDFFHALGISHLLLKRDLVLRELESFIELLAGAKSGQGDDVLAALVRENVKHISLGLLNYSIFSGVQAVAMQLFPSGDDPSVWRHLILQPAGLGNFNLDLEKVKAIARLHGGHSGRPVERAKAKARWELAPTGLPALEPVPQREGGEKYHFLMAAD